ncbi:helix-turn-helix domain-containing protein [Brachyspira catarrhinii]|uniref:Helix-turn-helix domain-containing protein n=1 Tax=Brachyspira catarrhinii TaxID=2528966 RepID=A0ABY2TTE4_9SPIR|nr:helix-turn-helix domain-containing protein [Brachyspira catarrhinii]TKZ36153.1 hypothetical protein EZH24_01615 [Brachyspira catarrhinii]
MSISEEDRSIARFRKKGYILSKNDKIDLARVLEVEEITQKVLINDAEESLKSLQDFNGANSIELKRKINKNSVETSLNMKGENGTVNFNKKEFNNGSVIEEKSIFNKPESIEERRDISKELKEDGYTQRERANMMGCSQPTISRDDKANKNKRKS